VVWGGGRYPYYPPPPHYRPPPYRPPPGYRPPPPGYRPPGVPPPDTRPPATTLPTQWQPDKSRLQRGGSPRAAASITSLEAKGWSSAGNRPETRPTSATRPAPSTGTGVRPDSGTIGNRPSTGTVGNRPAAGSAPSITQPQTRPSPSSGQPGAGTARPAQGGPVQPGSQRPAPSRGALGDMNTGANAGDFGNRGASSRGKSAAGGSGNRRGTGRQ
jgi:hypothetical protein